MGSMETTAVQVMKKQELKWDVEEVSRGNE